MRKFEKPIGDILYGRHAVMEALKKGRTFEKILLLQTPHPSPPLLQVRRMADTEGVPVLFAPREKLDHLARSDSHQGVVAMLSSSEYASLEDILEKPGSRKVILILDHLEDPQNLGSLLRTCDALGVSGVVIPSRRAAGLSPGAAKASAGAIQHVPVARVSNLHQVLLRLKALGFTVIGADQSAEDDFQKPDYSGPLALVLGNEHKGLSFLLKNTCDRLVKIPIKGHLDSLNVSVAGALILYQMTLSK